MQTENPYKAPPEVAEDPSPVTSPNRQGGDGPAIPIVVGTFIGGIVGLTLLIQTGSGLGFLGSMPGAVAGTLYYRFRSSAWPIDPTAKRRRYIYALIATLPLPTITAYTTGMRGQGFTMTMIVLWVSASVGIGILLSGNRRPAIDEQS